jgi:hypothetical protein
MRMFCLASSKPPCGELARSLLISLKHVNYKGFAFGWKKKADSSHFSLGLAVFQ